MSSRSCASVRCGSAGRRWGGAQGADRTVCAQLYMEYGYVADEEKQAHDLVRQQQTSLE
jgi:hypothetical protein